MRGQFFFVPIDVATTPTDGKVITDRYWTVHPDKGLAFYVSRRFRQMIEEDPAPQCNASEPIAVRLDSSLAKYNPGCEIKHIPVVFLGHARKAWRDLEWESASKMRANS